MLCAHTGAQRIARLCPRCGSAEHGRPTTVGPTWRRTHVSISYTHDLVAVAWSREGPVGIDVERGGPDLQGWTRLEALLKATGRGLDDLPDAMPEHLPDVAHEALPLPAGYVGTLAGPIVGATMDPRVPSGVSWRLAGPAVRDRPATR